jgi:chromate transport protein ChrA
MVLPGPEAQQLATYIGWLMHRTWGGLVAGGLFVLPSLLILVGLSWVYMAYGHLPLVAGVFAGIKPAVTALVLHAAHRRIGSRVLRNAWLWAIAVAAFVAIFALRLPFPVIVLGGRVLGVHGWTACADRVFAWAAVPWRVTAGYGPAVIDDDTPTPGTLCSRVPGWRQGAGRMRLVGGRCWHGLVLTGGWQGTRCPDGLVLHQGGAADLRWRLCGPALCVPGRGGAAPLGVGHADDRRPGAGRDHAGAADHGGGFRRVRRRLAGQNRCWARKRCSWPVHWPPPWSPSSPSCRRSFSSWLAGR